MYTDLVISLFVIVYVTFKAQKTIYTVSNRIQAIFRLNCINGYKI